jgi:hypothetical protein
MKIRLGFVSNSSSSSFLAVIKKEDWDKAIATLSDFTLRAIKDNGCLSVCKVFGMDAVSFSYMTGNIDFSEESDEEEVFVNRINEKLNKRRGDFYDEVRNFSRLLEKKYGAFIHKVDC